MLGSQMSEKWDAIAETARKVAEGELNSDGTLKESSSGNLSSPDRQAGTNATPEAPSTP